MENRSHYLSFFLTLTLGIGRLERAATGATLRSFTWQKDDGRVFLLLLSIAMSHSLSPCDLSFLRISIF
jgi:hypothetical protein